MKKRVLRILVFFSAVAIVCLTIDFFVYIREPDPALSELSQIEIKKGLGFREVVNQLYEKKIISSRVWFMVLARMEGAVSHMQAGEYTFTPGMTPREILEVLKGGLISGFRLVVPEGYTIFQIAQRLEESGLWSGKRFLELATDPDRARALDLPVPSLEGYLFPATYPLKRSMREEDIIEMMVRRGLLEKTPERVELGRKLGFSWHQVLTLASLIQAETFYRDEMPIIAGVFLKRLQLKMRLQCDPTAIYGIKNLDQGISSEDLKRDHPYNTYRHLGLPPGPIGNPGTDALLAALHPQAGEFLYFVADGQGRHLFAATFEEHKKNVKLLRQRGGP